MTDKADLRKSLCYQSLRRDILTLKLAPGADLDELRLTREHSLSRTPLREVLRQLAGEGYVDVRENLGVRVTEVQYTTLHEFFIAAPMIYRAVSSLAASNAQPAQIDALIAAQSDFKSALRSGSIIERALANTRFHEISGEMAHNRYLLPSYQRLLIDHARVSMSFYADSGNDKTQQNKAELQHDLMIAAIQARDSKAAAALASEHWALSRDQITRFVMPSGLDIPLGEAVC